MRTEGLENSSLKGHSGDKRDREKQLITYLTSLYKWLTEQELGDLVKSFIKSENRQKVVESYDRPPPEGS